MKLFYLSFITLFYLIMLASCSSDMDDFHFSKEKTTIIKTNDNLGNYLIVRDGQLVLNISKQEATLRGKTEEYEKLIHQIKQANNMIMERRNNPNATIGINLPSERIVMCEGKIISRTNRDNCSIMRSKKRDG